MAKLLNFTLEGEALRITGFLSGGRPVYTVEFMDEFTVGGMEPKELSFEELHRFASAVLEDVDGWNGILHRFPEDKFTNPVIDSFQKAWGGGSEADGVRMHTPPETGV